MNVSVSVIIPCYNSGKYLPEALESVRNSTYEQYEVVIVDDGSTDAATILLLEQLKKQAGYKIITQKNAGPAAARNTGARQADGEFLLFLDSDNKIRPSYISRGIEVLARRPDVGVVYGNASFFGYSSKPRFRARAFDIGSIMFGNYVDMCSLVRKKAWEDVGGLDEDRVLFGHEDWEFWIRIGLKGWKFEFIDEILFDYRIREDSLLHYAQDGERLKITKAYLCSKHGENILKYYKKYYQQFYLFQQSPIRSFIKFFYFRYILQKKYNP